MPWKELSKMDEKLQFLADLLRGEATMTELCEQHGISRQTGYQLKKRYLEEGATGLQERSRAPLCHGRRTDEEIARSIIDLRKQRPHWGAKKLLKTLRDADPHIAWPARSTTTDILKRAGLVRERRRRMRPTAVDQPFAHVLAANDTWCIDFKGWFRTGDGERCDPLTVTDAFSRYLLCCNIMAEQIAPVRQAVDRLFKEYGLPHVIRSDNGTPFSCAAAPAGLTRLSVHWLKLGIALERIVPGQPQQNGRHERMHKTLKAETVSPAATTRREQQKRFDCFREDFNDNRPHEALNMDTPAQHYRCSPRPMPKRVAELYYSADHDVRRVRSKGDIKWLGETVFISEALSGEPVGLTELENGDCLVRFASVDLGIIERKTRKLIRYTAGRPPRCVADDVSSTQPVRDVSGH
jgi:putative transposase